LVKRKLIVFKEFLKDTIYRSLYFILSIIFSYLIPSIFFKVKVRKEFSVPNDDNFIVSGVPHESWWDIPFMARAFGLKKQIKFVPRKDLSLFKVAPFLRPLLLSVDKKNFSRKQLRVILGVLKNGKTIGVFPEGSRIAKKKKPNPGIIYFSEKTNVKILPVHICSDDEYLYESGSWKNLFPLGIKFEIRMGQTYSVEELKEKFKQENKNKEASRKELASFLIEKTKKI